MVFPHRACGCAGGAAPIPLYGSDFSEVAVEATICRRSYIVAAGVNPAARTTLGRLVKGGKKEKSPRHGCRALVGSARGAAIGRRPRRRRGDRDRHPRTALRPRPGRLPEA